MTPQKKRVKKDPHLQNANSDSEMGRVKEYNPIELYQYSLDSKENQEIAKSISKKKSSKLAIFFDKTIWIRVKFSEEKEDEWTFEVENNGQNDKMVYDEKDRELKINVKENLLERGLKMFDELVDLFGCTLDCVILIDKQNDYGIKCDGLNNEYLPRVIEWINNSDCPSIPGIETRGIISSFHATIVQNIEKPVQRLRISGVWDTDEYPDGVKFNEKLVIGHFEMFYAPKLKTLLSINCEKLDLKAGTEMTNEEVNVFLRSWQNGESHTRLKANPHELEIRTSEKLKLKKILKGLSPVIRDPRTTKRFFIQFSRFDSWLHGGVDIIRRTDGQFMTIQCLHHESGEKDEKVPEHVIEDFEEYKNWDWNDETEDVELDNYDKCHDDGLLILHIW